MEGSPRPLHRPHPASQHKRETGSPALRSAQKGDARCTGAAGRQGRGGLARTCSTPAANRRNAARVIGDPRRQRVPFPRSTSGGHPRTGPGTLPSRRPRWVPWHTRGAPGQPEPSGNRSPPPRGTWPWQPALHPAPPPQPPHFRPKRGEPPDSRWTFPGAAALPGVRTGGCCPGSREETGGRDRLPLQGWEMVRAQQRGTWPVSAREKEQAGSSACSQGAPTPCHTHTLLTGIPLKAGAEAAAPTPTRVGAGGSGCCLEALPRPGRRGV